MSASGNSMSGSSSPTDTSSSGSDSDSDSDTERDTESTSSGGTSSGSGDGGSSSTGEAACPPAPTQNPFIWISNAAEGTISKIATDTLVEEGRYIVRPDANGNPSRTSVSLNGDVAVANREGGITVVAGNVDDCPDPMNTSQGGDDVLAWPDGCVRWHVPMVYASQRPVAWTQGEWNEETCRYENTHLWTAGANASIDVLLLDGDTGIIEQTVPIPGVDPNFYGIYGGAVDSEGNFWGSQLGQGTLIRVRLSDFAVTTWPMATTGYGMTVDSNDRVWTCSNNAARFDPTNETWDVFDNVGGAGGCNADGNGLLWLANNPIVGIDIDSGIVQATIDLPNYVHGVAVDFEGNVWGAAIYNDEAYRVDPVGGGIDTVTGLNFPYTYSDMTGFALQNVSN